MTPIRMEKIESGIRLVLNYHEAFNSHDVDAMMRLVSEAFLFESSDPPPEGRCFHGKEEALLYWQEYFYAAPEAQREIEDISGMGMRCVVRWRTAGTAGQTGNIRGVDLFLVKEGLISEQYSYVKG